MIGPERPDTKVAAGSLRANGSMPPVPSDFNRKQGVTAAALTPTRTSPLNSAPGSARNSSSTSSRSSSASRTRKTTASSSTGTSSAPSPRSTTASTPTPSKKRSFHLAHTRAGCAVGHPLQDLVKKPLAPPDFLVGIEPNLALRTIVLELANPSFRDDLLARGGPDRHAFRARTPVNPGVWTVYLTAQIRDFPRK